MQLIKYPPKKDWNNILARPLLDDSLLTDKVKKILEDVRNKGDQAVLEYEVRFDGVNMKSLQVLPEEIEQAINRVPEDLKDAIRLAMKNIRTFHIAQQLISRKVETMPGVTCWQKAVPIQKIGLYVPGGTAPLFSTVIMLAVPAKIAGCNEIILCSPPDKNGNIHPAVLFAAHEAGVDKIFKIGGVQAIAAMTYGTESVPEVYKIFGPGNQYVTAAKQLVGLKEIAIDMPAGPSEVMVIADDTARPAFVASDMLSQAEHGTDSQAILLTTSETLAGEVLKEVESQLAMLPRKELAARSLEHSRIILLKNNEEIIAMSNLYAPEHLIIETGDYEELSGHIVNAGSVFLGHYTPESAGDYASGTNHTLPTNGYAKAYSGVNLDSFIKKITFQEISKEGLQGIGKSIEIMAANEALDAHKNAVSLRIK